MCLGGRRAISDLDKKPNGFKPNSDDIQRRDADDFLDEKLPPFMRAKEKSSQDEGSTRLDDDILSWLRAFDGSDSDQSKKKSGLSFAGKPEIRSPRESKPSSSASDSGASREMPRKEAVVSPPPETPSRPRRAGIEDAGSFNGFAQSENSPPSLIDTYPPSQSLMSALAPYVAAAFFFALIAGLTVFYFLAGSDDSKIMAGNQPGKNNARRWESGYGTSQQQEEAVVSSARIDARADGVKPSPKVVAAPAALAAVETKPIEVPRERKDPPPLAASPEPKEQIASLSQGGPEKEKGKDEAVPAKAPSQPLEIPKPSLEAKPADAPPPASLSISANAAVLAKTPQVQEAVAPPAPKPVAPPAPPAERTASLQPAPIPPQPARPVKPKPSVSPQQEADMLARSQDILKLGDVAGARLLLQYLADHGSGAGAFGLAQTYDPPYLAALGVRGLKGDSKMARSWYEKARALGSEEAASRLARQAD